MPDLNPVRSPAALSPEESGHLTRVLRLRAGARVLVFDGHGTQYLAEVVTAAKDRVTVKLREPVEPASEPRVRLTLAQAVLKGDKMDAVMRDATMMGVAAVLPIVTERTIVPLSAVELGRVRERWHRVAVASAKQCGRAVVPEIAPPRRFTRLTTDANPDLIEEVGADVGAGGDAGADADDVDANILRLQLVEPAAAGTADASMVHQLPAEPPARVLIAIGPEGGWSPEEVEQAREAGWRGWTLGARTLRAESAPLAALSILTYAWRL